MFQKILLLALSAGLMAPPLSAQQPPPRQFGRLIYPATGNLHLDEGSVELYVISGFDMEEDVKKNGAHALFLDLIFPAENWHYVINFINWAHGISMVGYANPQQSYVSFGHPRWKPDQPGVIAWTWSGRKRTLIVDGKLESEGKHGVITKAVDDVVEGWLHGDLTQARLHVGTGVFSVDEIRISSIARAPEELVKAKDAAPVADAHTLLLDHCDGGPAEVIAGFSGETGGSFDGVHEVVAGKYGKAVKLWKDQK